MRKLSLTTKKMMHCFITDLCIHFRICLPLVSACVVDVDDDVRDIAYVTSASSPACDVIGFGQT
jgi:hypothetical protein